jgi:hypothetical protein
MKTKLIALVTVAFAALLVAIPASSATALTATEASDLQYMREEEKLARDVYQALGAKWTAATVFQRIAQSEQRHVDAVKVVLDRYGIADPAAAMKPGEFVDRGLQKLYDTLVARGSVSLAAALQVGVQIENVDVADLQNALAETSNADLERLYGNLLRGSQNHLRAFTRTADGALPTSPAGQGRGVGFGQGGGLARGSGAGQGAQLRDGTCTGDGAQSGQGTGYGSGSWGSAGA